jgi:hypothetical protein
MAREIESLEFAFRRAMKFVRAALVFFADIRTANDRSASPYEILILGTKIGGEFSLPRRSKIRKC